MPQKPHLIYFPEMALTLVRRASSRLPHNHFLFRCAPKWTKLEIKEYLQKVYNVKVATISTYIAPGKVKRAPAKRNMLFKSSDYKKVYVRLTDPVAAPAENAAAMR